MEQTQGHAGVSFVNGQFMGQRHVEVRPENTRPVKFTACGFWGMPGVMGEMARLQGQGFWSTLVFLANAVLFLLVGLQLHALVHAVLNEYGWATLIADAFMINATVIAMRLIWFIGNEYKLMPQKMEFAEQLPTALLVTLTDRRYKMYSSANQARTRIRMQRLCTAISICDHPGIQASRQCVQSSTPFAFPLFLLRYRTKPGSYLNPVS